MISLELTAEQEDLRLMVRRFAREKIADRAQEFNAQGALPIDLVQAMGELGLFGIPFPEEFGGAAGDFLSFCLAVEEIGRVDQSLGATLASAVGVGALPIFEFGTDEQRRMWLPSLVRGEALGSFGLTEAGAGSDASGISTTAVRDGEEWIINGSKQFITNAGNELSKIVIVAAVTSTGPRRVSTFIVEAGTPGYLVGNGYRKVGWHASDTRDLAFVDCRVPAANMLGEEGRGLSNFLHVLDRGRVGFAALAVGLIQGCVDECLRYVNERSAFGRPIGQFQAIQFKIADMQMKAQTARLSYWNAAWLIEQGKPATQDAAIAKLYASESAVAVARDAAQIFGGYGFTTEFAVGRFYQDSKILEVGEGTSEIQRMLIARSLGLR